METPSSQVINLCVLGPAGIGKSPLDALFRNQATTIEPYRVRKAPRGSDDRYYVASEVLQALLSLCRELGEPFYIVDSKKEGNSYLDGSRRWIEIYGQATFFTVRNVEQVLLHSIATPTSTVRKIEVFGPVLASLLSRISLENRPRFITDVNLTFFILLNPCKESFRQISGDQVIQAYDWPFLQRERARRRGKVADEIDVQARIASLLDELAAWKSLWGLQGNFDVIEVTEWDVFEYTYYPNPEGKEDPTGFAKKQLKKALNKLLLTAKDSLEPQKFVLFQKCLATEEQIDGMKSVL